jgi:hypothetical protein
MANPTITVTRKDNGVAEYKFSDGSITITGKGFWDDATPWASNSYKASYWLYGRSLSSFRFGTPTNPDPIPNRKSIVFHLGTDTGNTEGCLVDADDFVGRVYKYLRGKDLAPEYINMLANRSVNDYYNKNWNPLDIEVKGDFDYDVELSISGGKTSYKEGDVISLEISLTGAGAKNGLSKDVWFHLNFSGTGSLKSDLKSNNLASLPSPEGTSNFKNDNQWVKLSAGQQKVTVALSSVFDDLEEGTENFNVTIDDYFIRRQSNISGEKFYKSEGPFPINGSNDRIAFDLKDQEAIFDKLIESGGQGNFTFTAPVAPKQIIGGQFTSYSIPDRLIVKDGNITLLDTGTVSVTGMPINFNIPDNSAGNISITVQAPLGGTAWNFSLISGGRQLNNFSTPFIEELEPLAVNTDAKAHQKETGINAYMNPIFREGEVSLEVQPIKQTWVINTYTTSVLVEGKLYDTVQAIRFNINQSGDTSKTREIGWRVKPAGDSPISASDFESGTLPEGILTLSPNVESTVDINFERLDTTGLSEELLDLIGPINDFWGLKQDGLQEGEESWTIELYDPLTGNIIPASFNGNSLFSVRDNFFFVEPKTGSDNGELLGGDNLPNLIFGSGGDDTIKGYAGDDILYGDNGNDIIEGGIGDDIIEGGFGNDMIDGGAGSDTLRIYRPKSRIALTKQSDGSYLLEDLSDVSFGIDTLKSIETVEFSDGKIQLDANSPTFTLKSNSSELFEGDRISVSIATTNVPSGTPLYWSLSGAGVTSSDLSNGMATGTGAVGADGRYAFSTVIAVDSVSDPNESLQIKFFSDAGRTTQIGDTIAVLVKEITVGNPTDGSDIIQGTTNDASAREIISGIPLSSSLRGKQTVDILTGLGGPDTFVLGDATGTFYDDGITTQKGSLDLGAIVEFSTEDLIQLHGSPSDYRLSRGAFTAAGFANTQGLYINKVTPGSLDEIVGFVAGATLATLSLSNYSQFIYANPPT